MNQVTEDNQGIGSGDHASPPTLLRGDRLRHDLRLVTLAWVFGAIWMWTINGAVMTQFARKLGTPDWAFGLIATMPFMGVFFQLPAGWFLDRYGFRKITFLFAATTHRLLWVAIAAIPWVLPQTGDLWWITLLVLLLLNWAIANIPGPAWMGWMSDVIPRKVRGRYFGFRNRIGQMVGITITLVIGWLLDSTTRAQGDATGSAMLIMSLILGVAGICGALDILCFIPIQDDYPRKLDPGKSLLSMIVVPLVDRDFRIFLGFIFTLNLAIGFIGQYVWLYAVKELGMSNLQAQVMIIGLPLLCQMIAYPFWGGLIDRLGRKPVLLVCSTTIIFGSLGWLFMGPDVVTTIDWSASWEVILWKLTGGHWSWMSWLGYLGILLTTITWPGVELANFNIVMDLAGGKDGNKKREGGAAYVVVNSIAVAIGGVMSGLFASVLTRHIEGIRMLIPLLGIVLTYHGVLFIVSSLLRLAALLFVIRLHEPKAMGTRAAIEFMGQTFYANVRNVVVVPSRVVEQAYRWTYLLRVPVNKRIRFGGLQTRRWWRRWLR